MKGGNSSSHNEKLYKYKLRLSQREPTTRQRVKQVTTTTKVQALRTRSSEDKRINLHKRLGNLPFDR